MKSSSETHPGLWTLRISAISETRCANVQTTGLRVHKAYTSLGTSSLHIRLLSAHAYALCLEIAIFRELSASYAWWGALIKKDLVYALGKEVPKLVYALWTLM